jgi:hypothetical protein
MEHDYSAREATIFARRRLRERELEQFGVATGTVQRIEKGYLQTRHGDNAEFGLLVLSGN